MPAIISSLLAVLVQLAVGLHFAAWLCDWRGEVTKSFLVFTALAAAATGLLAYGAASLGRLQGVEATLLGALVVGLVAYTVLLASQRRPPRLAVGGVALATGLAAIVLGAVNRPSPALGPALTAFAFLAATAALGTGLGGLTLGHWYLTTPGLTARPLRLLCDLLLLSLIPLTALTAWYLLVRDGSTGFGPGGLSGTALWLGAGMVTVFPFAVTIAARVCCVDGPGRGRSIQAATGLLYLVAAAVLAGGLAGNAVLLGA